MNKTESKVPGAFLTENSFLDELSEMAKASPRLRMHFDLRDTTYDGSMRMFNALEPETVIPIHCHTNTSEDVVCIRGCVEEVLFDNKGKELTRFRLAPSSGIMHCHVPIGVFHTCRSLESGSVILEFKNGKYDPDTTETFL